jgi:RimJ/RimL family protein N-acetyltransferase
VVLTTARLRLRAMSMDDLDFVAAMLADVEVMRYYPTTHTRSEARAWIARQIRRYAADGHGLWLAESRETRQGVGQVGLVAQHVEGVREAEVGYLIARLHWRQGLATEAAAGVRDWAFGVLGLRRVISLIRPENTPSQGVARKLGMAREREVVHAGLRHVLFAVSA